MVDPIRQTRGFFRWRGSAMEPTGGFFLTAERGARVALARLANDLENLTDAHADRDGGFGGLTPRLEAELIAMLSRPATHVHSAPTAIDRSTMMLACTMLGALFGMVALSAVLWLTALNGHVADQGRILEELRKDVSQTAERQRAALDAAGGATADELLRKISRERDKATAQLHDQVSVNDLLANRTRELDDKLASLQARYDKAKRYEADAKEYSSLRDRYETLKFKNDTLVGDLDNLEALLDSPDGKKAAALALNYRRAWYAAAAGWGVSIALALGLAGGYVLLKYPSADADGRTDEPRHEIS